MFHVNDHHQVHLDLNKKLLVDASVRRFFTIFAFQTIRKRMTTTSTTSTHTSPVSISTTVPSSSGISVIPFSCVRRIIVDVSWCTTRAVSTAWKIIWSNIISIKSNICSKKFLKTVCSWNRAIVRSKIITTFNWWYIN